MADPEKAQPVPDDMKDIVAEYKNQIAEAIAMSDDELMEKYFSGEEFSEAELTRGVRLGVRNGEIRPVYSGSATHTVGIERLMDLIVKYFPTYGEHGSIVVTDSETQEPVELETNEKESLCAQVFKTIVDPFVGRISYIKVLSGVMSSDSVVYNATKEKPEKISTIFIVKGKHQTAVGKLFTGDIGAVVKLQYTQTNDTLCEKGKHYLADPIAFSEPMLGMAVFPKSKNDEDKMSNALARMVEEDPTLRLENNKETKQTILYGIGDQHIDVVLNKLQAKYKVEVRLETPKVPYRETIRKKQPEKDVIRNNPVVMDSLAMSLSTMNQIRILKKWCLKKRYLVEQCLANTSRQLKPACVNAWNMVFWLALRLSMSKRHCLMVSITMSIPVKWHLNWQPAYPIKQVWHRQIQSC